MTPAPSSISAHSCFHHPLREAAAKCVGCGRPFCRECVTPVDRRMFCASCYAEQTASREKPKSDWFIISVTGQVLLGLFGLWFTAYFLGRLLLELPSNFHEGTVWERLMR